MDLFFPVRRFSDICDRLRAVKGCRPQQKILAWCSRHGDRPERRFDHGRRLGGCVSFHRGRGAVAAHHARRVPFGAALALCRRARRIGQCCGFHRALVPTAFNARSLVAGRHVGILDVDTSKLLFHPGAFRRRLVCGPDLRSPVQQSRPDFPAVRDHDALWQAARRDP